MQGHAAAERRPQDHSALPAPGREDLVQVLSLAPNKILQHYRIPLVLLGKVSKSMLKQTHVDSARCHYLRIVQPRQAPQTGHPQLLLLPGRGSKKMPLLLPVGHDKARLSFELA